jgi:hypothetical protein
VTGWKVSQGCHVPMHRQIPLDPGSSRVFEQSVFENRQVSWGNFVLGSTALLLGLGLFFSSLIWYTVGRTPWTGDQPVARPRSLKFFFLQHKSSFWVLMTWDMRTKGRAAGGGGLTVNNINIRLGPETLSIWNGTRLSVSLDQTRWKQIKPGLHNNCALNWLYIRALTEPPPSVRLPLPEPYPVVSSIVLSHTADCNSRTSPTSSTSTSDASEFVH